MNELEVLRRKAEADHCRSCFFAGTIACSYCKHKPKMNKGKRFDPEAGYRKLFGIQEEFKPVPVSFEEEQ